MVAVEELVSGRRPMELIYSLVAERQKQIALAAGIARPGPAIAAEVG